MGSDASPSCRPGECLASAVRAEEGRTHNTASWLHCLCICLWREHKYASIYNRKQIEFISLLIDLVWTINWHLISEYLHKQGVLLHTPRALAHSFMDNNKWDDWHKRLNIFFFVYFYQLKIWISGWEKETTCVLCQPLQCTYYIPLFPTPASFTMILCSSCSSWCCSACPTFLFSPFTDPSHTFLFFASSSVIAVTVLVFLALTLFAFLFPLESLLRIPTAANSLPFSSPFEREYLLRVVAGIVSGRHS